MNGLSAKRLSQKVFTICFEGNIGSGKTSSLKYLSKKCDKVMAVSEPLDKWTDMNGYNMIEMLYKDLKRNAFAFEHFAQLTRLWMFEDTLNSGVLPDKPIRLMERSIDSQRYCFTENLFQCGNLPKPEFIVLDEWFRWLSAKSCFRADLIVYLRASPQTVFERIKKRSRSGETEIPFEYLQQLHELHDKWLLDSNRSPELPNVLTINTDLDLKEVYSALDQHFEPIFKDFQ